MAKLTAPVPSEHEIQKAFIQLCLWAEKVDRRLELAFAVPNGGARTPLQGALLKAEGQRNGVPDWMFPYPNGQFLGLAIEFKKPGTGRLSESQAEYIPKLQSVGWLVCVHTDAAQAFREVKDYLRLSPTIIEDYLQGLKDAH